MGVVAVDLETVIEAETVDETEGAVVEGTGVELTAEGRGMEEESVDPGVEFTEDEIEKEGEESVLGGGSPSEKAFWILGLTVWRRDCKGGDCDWVFAGSIIEDRDKIA